MEYRERAIETSLRRILRELPGVMLVGPRAVGKTTTAAWYARTLIRLDRPAEAAAFEADPDAALRDLAEPVVLDEWQVVPDCLGAVKRTVDVDPRPGRFLLTGSARIDLTAEQWPATGRLVRLPMFGMTVAERGGRPHSRGLMALLAAGAEVASTPDSPDLRGYVELALQSGFPEPALALSGDTTRAWLEAYVDQLVTRDADLVEPGRDPDRLRRYLEAYAVTSSGVVDETTLLEAAGINRKTAQAYERLLVNLHVVHRLPAWSTNRLKRLVKGPKRYLADPGLFAGVLRVDVDGVMRDGALMGRLLDALVVMHLRVEAEGSSSRPRLFHLRTEQGRHEVDVIGELAGGGVVAIEVKASAAPRADAARHLAWLKERLGTRFLAGAVLHTGPRTYALAEGIIAAPIATLWS